MDGVKQQETIYRFQTLRGGVFRKKRSQNFISQPIFNIDGSFERCKNSATFCEKTSQKSSILSEISTQM